ncbi:LysR substrate-binding domain-containing protein [Paracoccus marcusii]|uniref:LysR substrate-binding domain-containing protein n=1 Tax=Paracoccus marcusii TaxID=59779 RepID=UPI002ED5624D|nr:LysR substrate-binding domain-containing protein [Paracoccus marcusii]
MRARDIGRDLHLREAQTDRLLDELQAGRLDAIVVASPPEGPGLQAIPLFADRFLLAGSAARIADLRSRPLSPDALDPGQLLLLDEGHCLGDQALEVCGLNRRAARLDLGAASLSTLCRLAAQGMGLTFLPRSPAGRSWPRHRPDGRQVSRPQPARQVMLMRRASTPGQGWFDDLARLLTAAARPLLDLG